MATARRRHFRCTLDLGDGATLTTSEPADVVRLVAGGAAATRVWFLRDTPGGFIHASPRYCPPGCTCQRLAAAKA